MKEELFGWFYDNRSLNEERNKVLKMAISGKTNENIREGFRRYLDVIQLNLHPPPQKSAFSSVKPLKM